jgi:transcriptional regulator with XRE-family HTH domain
MQKQYQDKDLLDQIIAGIKAIRKSKDITLEVFYFDTGIHLARIEQGKTNITVSTLSKICTYFEMNLIEFFTFCDKINNIDNIKEIE